MMFLRSISLVLLLLFYAGCELAAKPPLMIHVTGQTEGAPYRMNGNFYTPAALKKELTATLKEFPEEFSKPVREPWEGGGLLVVPDEGASFTAVTQLLQLLKECNVTAYSIRTRYKENPKAMTNLTLPVYSADLDIEHEPIDPEPPQDPPLTPQQRIGEITEKMGGLRRK